MIDLKKLATIRAKNSHSLLGLALDGSRLEGVWLKRAGDTLSVQSSLAVNLTLDPLTAAPELLGREIRNHLDAAEMRERSCVVALPLRWALAAQVQIPQLPEADVASFLALEAERSFPCDVTTLVTAFSRCKVGEQEVATLVGVPRTHVTAVETALRAAGLHPRSFSLGITSLQPPTQESVLALAIGESHVRLQVTHGGGVLLLRALEGALEQVSGRTLLDADVVSREVRITLGQLPDIVRTTLKHIRVFGPAELAGPLAGELQGRVESAGIKVEVVRNADAAALGLKLPADLSVSAAEQFAAQTLAGRATTLEFLPPRVSRWQQFMSRYGTGKLRKAGLVAGSVVGVVILAFLWQQILLWRLQSKWDGMKVRVTDLEATQANIKKFRPWFDESARSLSILRQLTRAFPEDGVVTAKSVEIREANLVTCTGTAKDNAALFRTLAELRKAGNVADLKVNRIQGKSPMQFTFDFRWVEGGASAN